MEDRAAPDGKSLRQRRDQPAHAVHTVRLKPATPQKVPMTLCPIALAIGCQKCPIFKVCPVKSVIGDSPKAAPPAAKPVAKPAARSAAKTAAARKKPKKK